MFYASAVWEAHLAAGKVLHKPSRIWVRFAGMQDLDGRPSAIGARVADQLGAPVDGRAPDAAEALIADALEVFRQAWATELALPKRWPAVELRF